MPHIVNGPYDSINPSVIFTNPVTMGNLLIAVFLGNTATGTTVTDNASPTPNTWLKAVENPGTPRGAAIWYAIANSNQPVGITVTLNGSANPTGTTAIEVSGATTLDNVTQGSGTGASFSFGPLATSKIGITVAGAYVNGSALTGTGGSWVFLSTAKGNLFETLTPSVPGSITISGTESTAGEYDGVAANFYLPAANSTETVQCASAEW